MNAPSLRRTPVPFRLLALPLCGWLAATALGQGETAPSVAPAAPQAAASAAVERVAPALAPFTATYEAYRQSNRAGDATLRLVHGEGDDRWRIDLDIHGDRGFAGVLGLNLQQSTVFEAHDGNFRPLSQSTVRKGLFLGKKTVGVYDWGKRSAQWRGDIKDRHKAAVPLQEGDMSGLLINLAIVRDAQPDRVLHYRYVDGGRARDHAYRVAAAPEAMSAGELSFETLRVARTNGGNDETLVWVADGVPTPIRILQREDGEDAIDLRLIQYQGH
ncbi:MAG: DUF3108 domain-containing protein [Xanthomonadaceae bacterium]|nr:DUF3108 domain-containing protein [Xanthomonadaceae bacterium]